MNLKEYFNNNYSDFLDNFKELSYDSTHREHLCTNETYKYHNFDKIVKKKYPTKTPSSVDTVIFKNNKIYLVEFKNQERRIVVVKEIKKKLKSSVDFLNENIQELSLNRQDYKFIFCVVFKRHTSSKIRIKNRSITNKICFDLQQYINKDCVDSIVTNNVDFFRDQFIQKTNKQLTC